MSMTFRQIAKERYGNGRRKDSFFRIMEIVVGAGIIGLATIAYQGWKVAPELAHKVELTNQKVCSDIGEIKKELENVKQRQFWVLEDLVYLRDAIEEYVKKPVPRPTKVRP